MGTPTTVTPLSPTRPLRRAIPLHQQVDIPLLAAVIALLIFGVIMVYSASLDPVQTGCGSPTCVLENQLKWLVVGILAAIAAAFFNYRNFPRYVLFGMLVTIVLLISVLLIQDVVNASARSVTEGSGRPSELAKIMIILYMAVWLNSKKDVINNIYFGLIPMIAILGIVGGFIVLQPDLSAAVTIFALGGLLFFLAGAELRQIVLVLFISILIGFLIVEIGNGWQTMDNFLKGLQNPENAIPHVKRTIEAIVRGGFFGVGIGRGITKFTGLPYSWTDSIFAVIVEETGLVGGFLVIALYMVILWRGLRIVSRTTDPLGKLIAGGITFWITIEVLLNIGFVIDLLPSAGNVLPFISSGGTSLVIMLISIGILTNIARMSKLESKEEGRISNAVIDLRRRDRRRGVSSPGSPVSPGQ
jgi:cell division protein FtsW